MNIEEIQVKSFKFHSYGGTNNLGKKLINVKCVDCGYIKEVRKDKFLCGSISKCVCKEFTLENMKDKRINDFIVVAESNRNNRPSFILKCIHCGELINVEKYKIVANKNIPKCICVRYKGRMSNNHRCDNLVGTYLTDRHLYVAEKIRMKDNRVGLKLVCTECGKSYETYSFNVLNNQYGYCECDDRYKWNTIDGAIRKYKKYINTKINNLYIKKVFRDKQGVYRFLCDCSCGSKNVSVMANRLVRGDIFSCSNCKRSFGESIIQQYLELNNIEYKSEVSFPDLLGKKKKPYRFDFGIYLNGKLLGLIEFDGAQHNSSYYLSYISNLNDKELEEKMREYKFRDEEKNKYCKNNNIPLLRIGYTRSKNKIEKFVYNFLVEIGGI